MSTPIILGAVVMTAAVADHVAQTGVRLSSYIDRHRNGDWGTLCDDDRATNQHAVEHGERVMSVYNNVGNATIWIITEWDRSSTCVLFPSDY